MISVAQAINQLQQKEMTMTKRKFSGTINFPEPIKTGATALRRGGIDWTVRAESLESTTGLPGSDKWVATLRNDTNQMIGVNGRRHTVIQNEALAVLGDTIIQMNAGFSYIGGGGFPESDKTYLVLAGERTLNFGQADDNGFNGILLTNDFNGNSPLVATAFVGRPFCTNQIAGMLRGKKMNSQRLVSVSHTASSVWQIEAARDTLRAAVHEMDAIEQELQELIKIKVQEDQIIDALFPRHEEDAPARSITTWENKVGAFRAELAAPYNAHLKGSALGVVMAAQGVDEHGSRSADRDKARIDRVITANFPTMRRALTLV